jgi:predicted phage terminase large subunit-like protein
VPLPAAVLDTYRARAEGSTAQWPTPGALAKHIDRRTRQTPALDLIDSIMVRLLNDEIDKAIIEAPPQIGKSERVSHLTPLWALAYDPTMRVGEASADAELATRWGRQIKRDVEENPDLGIRLARDSRAAGRWETAQGGGLYCVGVGGTLTGRAVDLLIIDDPIKNRAQAESKAYRESLWDWYENVVKVRARRIVLMATRWHTDDLTGRLLANEPGEWVRLSLPAIAESDDDPLGREPGEEIESANPALHTPGWFHSMQKSTSPYVWNSLYQQRPTSAAGGIFKRGDWRFWQPFTTEDRQMLRLDGDVFELTDCSRFITIDLATSTKTSADYTVAAAWGITLRGDLVLLDWKREQVAEVDHADFLAPLRQRWLGQYDVTHIESRMFGTTLVYALGRAGVPVAELEADVDKLTRALPYAGLVRQHRVWLPGDAPRTELDAWIDEHADFDKGKNDDQVDVGAYAARVAIAHWLPPETSEQQAATAQPHDPDYVDLMTANW